MNKVNRMTVHPQLEELPRLQVVTPRNGEVKRQAPLAAPLQFPSNLYKRVPRAETVVLGWKTRATRLAKGE